MRRLSADTTTSSPCIQPAIAALGGLVLAALALMPGAQADVTTSIPSGLDWRSGTTIDGFPCVAQLRSRTLDAITVFMPKDSFPVMVTKTGAQWSRKTSHLAPLWVVSMPLLPTSNKGQFAQCAAGNFDSYFNQMGTNLKAGGAQGTVIRLGWEANIGSGSHPWGVDSPSQVPDYIQCWRHAALALKAGGPGLNVEWTNAKKTQNKSLHVLDMYPGDDVVDVIGVHYYDAGPEKNTQATWDKYYNMTYNGGPWGLGTWLAVAQQHGKKLGIGEWGVWRQGLSAAMADDPVYIDNMYQFFKTNAASLAYEDYFDVDSAQHALCPSTQFPNATAHYKANWTSGQ